jgi:hypothetical protein
MGWTVGRRVKHTHTHTHTLSLFISLASCLCVCLSASVSSHTHVRLRCALTAKAMCRCPFSTCPSPSRIKIPSRARVCPASVLPFRALQSLVPHLARFQTALFFFSSAAFSPPKSKLKICVRTSRHLVPPGSRTESKEHEHDEVQDDAHKHSQTPLWTAGVGSAFAQQISEVQSSDPLPPHDDIWAASAPPPSRSTSRAEGRHRDESPAPPSPHHMDTQPSATLLLPVTRRVHEKPLRGHGLSLRLPKTGNGTGTAPPPGLPHSASEPAPALLSPDLSQWVTGPPRLQGQHAADYQRQTSVESAATSASLGTPHTTAGMFPATLSSSSLAVSAGPVAPATPPSTPLVPTIVVLPENDTPSSPRQLPTRQLSSATISRSSLMSSPPMPGDAPYRLPPAAAALLSGAAGAPIPSGPSALQLPDPDLDDRDELHNEKPEHVPSGPAFNPVTAGSVNTLEDTETNTSTRATAQAIQPCETEV